MTNINLCGWQLVHLIHDFVTRMNLYFTIDLERNQSNTSHTVFIFSNNSAAFFSGNEYRQ